MEARERSLQAFIILGQAAKACRPGEGSFDHPAPGQEHESLLGLLKFHHMKLDAMLFGVGSGFSPV